MKKLILIFGAVGMFTLGSFTNSNVWTIDNHDLEVKLQSNAEVNYVKGNVRFKLEDENGSVYLQINLDSLDFESYYDFSNGDIWINN
tara:strand:+ start:132 stop:392 length:261 start_codon:yes stop_codon:yes gene_type:complete